MNIVDIKKPITILLVVINIVFICQNNVLANDMLKLETVQCQIQSSAKVYEFDIHTDCIRYHSKANGYEKYKGLITECNMPDELELYQSKMTGYGNYVFKPDTNLFNFIEFCYSKDPSKTIACANKIVNCDYEKLMSYKNKVINNTIFKEFWINMCGNFTDFNKCQDEFFFLNYTYPATVKAGVSLKTIENKKQDGEPTTEYLTALTSYMYSTRQNAAVNEMTVEKGDIIPFIYYKEADKRKNKDKNKEKNNEKPDFNLNDSESLKEIAKFAYVALIEGWCSDVNGYNFWKEEYENFFGPYNNDDLGYEIDTIKRWYDDAYDEYKNQRGKKGNNLLGSDIETIIQSDYSIEQQLEATEYYLRKIFDELGINSDFKEIMARNELMSRYMMENSHIKDAIKDYSVSIKFITENLQRGTSEHQNTHTVVTDDFQVIEFDYTSDQRYNHDSDNDGLYDGKELGNVKWVDITEFVRKTYESAVANNQTKKRTFEEQVDDIIYKNGGHIDFNGNKVDGSVKWDNTKTKVLYKTYNYNSNPMLMDTDFDGINDNDDGHTLNGTFEAKSEPIGQVEWTNDFRYFFVDNNKYNDELSTMSLINCTLAEGGLIKDSEASGNMDTYLKKIGFDNIAQIRVFKLSETENITGNLYIGKKTIQIGANKKSIKRYKDVYGIFLGGFDTEPNYKKLLANFNKDQVAKYHANIVADIQNKVADYVGNNKTINDYCYWVSGYSIAGGLAAEVATGLKDDNEVYCYTFGATNTNITGSGAYAEIKNIINEDDLYPKIYNVEDGFYRSGTHYNDSICDNLRYEYRQFGGNINIYITSPRVTNTIKKYIQKVYNEVTKTDWIDTWENILADYFKSQRKVEYKFNDILHPIQSLYSTNLKILLNHYGSEIELGHELKAYYVLSKSLNGFDLNNEDVGWNEVDEVIPSERYLSESEKRLMKKFSEIDYDRFPCFQDYKYIGEEISQRSPMMFQSAEIWSSFRYGTSPSSSGTYKTIANVGCGATSMAMAVSTLSKKTITPVDVRNKWEQEGHSDYYILNKGTNWNAIGKWSPLCFGIENSAENDDRTVTEGDDKHFCNAEHIIDQLSRGHVVIGIAHGEESDKWENKPSQLTKGGHFVCIVGCNEEDLQEYKKGKLDKYAIGIYICDPSWDNQKNLNICVKEKKLDYFISHGKDKAGIDAYWAFSKGTSESLKVSDFNIPFDSYDTYFYDSNPYDQGYSKRVESGYSWKLPENLYSEDEYDE
jgi:hypothetical protein